MSLSRSEIVARAREVIKSEALAVQAIADQLQAMDKSLVGIVKVTDYESSFENGVVINPRELLKKGLISKIKPRVKILGNGELSKKFVIEGCIVSKSAEEKIKKAKGKILV